MDKEKGTFAFDKVIHERVRLLILTYLAGKPDTTVSFNELKEGLELTAGNLSVQIRNLESAGYVTVHKQIRNRKPETTLSLTPDGLKSLMDYLDEMERIIRTVKGPNADGT